MVRFVPVLMLVVFTAVEVRPQAFTKITTGSIVNDGAASRGVVWLDFDGDSDLDLFVTNGKEGGEPNFLYRNNGNGTFEKISDNPLVQLRQPWDGASLGDADNDGDPDVFVVAWYDSNNVFYQNNGNGTFTAANIGSPSSDRGYSETCSWGDYDNDGKLDLYVSNSGSPSIGAKRNFLYRNTGSSFVRIDTGVVATEQFYSRGVSWVDYDDDGDIDLFVTNERNQANNLYKNMLKELGSAFFTKITAGALVTDIASSLSASWADYDNDGDLDVFVANGWPSGQHDNLYQNNGNGTFSKVTTGDPVNDGQFSLSSGWADFDNDGDLDLFVTTAFSAAAAKNLLYKNMLMETGTATLQKVTTGDVVNDTGYSYGFSWGDYDKDGDLDLFVAKTYNENENNVLYRNDNSNGNHWILLNCLGTVSNRTAIGTKVRVKATINGTPVWQLRVVEGQSGYCGQNLQLHFGLGNAITIDSIIVQWPSGPVEYHTNVSVDRIANVVEGGGLSSLGGLNREPLGEFLLGQNYPNPFNPITIVPFVLANSAMTALRVFDATGREVATLVSGMKSAGHHVVAWDATGIASGVYYYALQSGARREIRKMVLMK